MVSLEISAHSEESFGWSSYLRLFDEGIRVDALRTTVGLILFLQWDATPTFERAIPSYGLQEEKKRGEYVDRRWLDFILRGPL